MKEYVCTNCGKKFGRYPSTVRNESKVFCNQTCKNIKQKSSNLGDKNPNFRSGKWSDRGKRRTKFLAQLDSFILKYITQCTSFQEIESKIKEAGFEIGRNAISRRVKKLGLSIDHFVACRHRSIPNEMLFTINNVCRRGTVKKRILEEKLLEYVCAICGQGPEWNGKPLVLEIDHINGNRFDNRLENLRILCPHCHSQTSTNKGRNAKRNI
jgi:DNA-directed RNA polymerase subunit RPC12/RpoP